MKLIIRNARILDKSSDFNGKILDIYIQNGKIQKLAKNISAPADTKEISGKNICVSTGWVDSSASFGEPGNEDSETISNGLNVAAKSGFTGIMLQPDTIPTVDNQALVSFIKHKSTNSATELFPIGSLTKSMAGTELAELFDMKEAGAVAFGDFKKTISNPQLMKIAMQYVQDFDGKLIAFANDKNLAGKGVVNEGKNSTQLGLKGIPAIAESTVVSQLLQLLEEVGGNIHIATISTAESVRLIRAAKNKGLKVSCSVSVNNLLLTDDVLMNFETRFKLMPPLREKSDCDALIEGVIDGTIDMITSDHIPVDIERKKMEFDLAHYGSIGLESCFGALCSILPVEIIVDKLTAAREIFSLGDITIQEGSLANLTFFDTIGENTFSESDIYSKSKNSAMIGINIKGKVIGICRGKKLIINL